MTYEGSGRRTPRRSSRSSGRERGRGDVDPGSAYLSATGPHLCDLCDAAVATLDALRRDCSDHDHERESDVDGVRTGRTPTDPDVEVGDVGEIGSPTAHRTERDPIERQIAAAWALLRASREAAEGDGARDAIRLALGATTPSRVVGGPVPEYELVRRTVSTAWHAGGPRRVAIPEAAQYVDVRYDGLAEGSESDLQAEIRYLLPLGESDV